jgi:hypothetical protein
MAKDDEQGRADFFVNMVGAPATALATVDGIITHFRDKPDVAFYFRSVPDLRLAAKWRNPNGRVLQQVFVTVQWQPQKRAFRIGAYVYPNVWDQYGFEGAKLFKADPLISYISIPETHWATKQSDLLAVLDAAKIAMLGKRQR